MVRIPSLLVSGPDLLDPGEASGGANGDAVGGVEHRLGEVSGSGRIASSHVKLPTAGRWR